MGTRLRFSLCKILPIILIVSMLIGCNPIVPAPRVYDREMISNGEQCWGITLDQMKCDFRFLGEEKTVSMADEIMDGQLYVDSNFPNPVPYSIEDFDWNRLETNSPATFQLYLQALGMVKFLAYAALQENDPVYLFRAREFVESWSQYAYTPEQSAENPKLWYDHGASLRAENLIYFMLAAEQLDVADDALRSLIYQLMIDHGDFLSSEVTYVQNHNHGIFQDEALLYVSSFIPDYTKSNEWSELAKDRLQSQLEYAFTEEYVHVENSSSYCIGVIGLFYNTANFLLAIDDPYGAELKKDIEAMTDFYARCILPAGYPYALGDSYIGREYDLGAPNYDNEFLEYVQSRGESGSPPKSLSAYYPLSGYYFTQETYEKEHLQNATWTMFKAGYVSATHKHADDLSFLLYSKGHEIFIDPGMYNYMNGNIYRDYLISSRAHNTINVDGMTYSTTVENSSKTGLLHYEDTGEYRYVLGYSDMYPGVEIDRHFYSLNDAIVLFDDIHSWDLHTYSQMFHLSEDMKIISLDPAETILGIGETGYTVHIRQLGELPSLNLLRGEEDQNGRISGFASDFNNEIHPIHTLKYDLSGENQQFITVITIEDEGGQVKITNADVAIPQYVDSKEICYNAKSSTLMIGDVQIHFMPRVHTNVFDIQTYFDGNKVMAWPTVPVDGISYLWYLVDMEKCIVLERSNWSTDGKVSFDLPEQPFMLKAYTQDSYGQRRSSFVGGWSDFVSARQYFHPETLNYRHTEDIVTKIGEGVYRVTAGTDYALNYTIRWYVYKNGSYYTNITTKNENHIELELTEPGSYTVSYYFKTANGDQEYWIIPELLIP